MCRYAILLAAIAIVGCEGSESTFDTGPGCLEDGPTGLRCSGDDCGPEITTIGLNDLLPGGFTVAQRVEEAAGVRQGTLTWLGGDDAVTVMPDSGATDVELELTRLAGKIELSSDEHCEDSQGIAEATFPARLRMVTSDGALDESWPVRAQADAYSTGLSLQHGLSELPLTGTLSAQSQLPGHDVQMHLDARFEATMTPGSISASAVMDFDGGGSESDPVTIATWTAAPAGP